MRAFWAELKRALLIWLAPTVVVTAFYLHYSAFGGRLAIPIIYDDLDYIGDGLKRLLFLENEGLISFLYNWQQDQPHSPFSTLMALVGFGLFGPHSWAPYAMNGLVLLLFFVAFHFLTEGLVWWRRAILLVPLLTPPLAANIIVEFRPDLAGSLLLACGILLTFDGRFFWQRWWRQALVGLLLGLSLWVKPTAFVAEIGTVLGLFFLAVAIELLMRFRQTSVWRIGSGLFIGLGIFALVGLPYVLQNAKDYIGYMKYAFYAKEKPIASFTGPWLDNLRYYWDGPAASFLVGAATVWWCFAIFLAAFAYLLWKGSREIILKGLAIVLVLAVLFAGPTSMPVKTPFFGSNFQMLSLLLLVGVLAEAMRRLPLTGLAVALVAGFGIAGTTAKNLPFIPSSPRFEYLRRAYADLVDLMPDLAVPGHENVVVTSLSDIDNYNLMLGLMEKGYTGFSARPLMMQSHVRAFPSLLATTDMVIASEPGNPNMDGDFPSNKVQEETLTQTRARDEFLPVAHILVHNGKGYCVFLRSAPFFGFIWDYGLFPGVLLKDGTAGYAGDNDGNSVRLFYPVPGDLHLNLDLSLKSPSAGQVVHVALNGAEVGTCAPKVPGEWTDALLDLPPALIRANEPNVPHLSLRCPESRCSAGLLPASGRAAGFGGRLGGKPGGPGRMPARVARCP
ncbi:MAG: hypothetical protein WDO13_14835 [Verrucomicrobiota bacterium]